MQHHTYSGSEGSAFLRELRGFLSFLASLWGTLTAVSLAFPLSNVFVRVIPLEGDESFNPLALMPSAPIAATATLVTLFLVLATFGARHEFAVPTRRRRLRRGAVTALALALAALALYLTGLQAVQNGLYGDTERHSGIEDCATGGWRPHLRCSVHLFLRVDDPRLHGPGDARVLSGVRTESGGPRRGTGRAQRRFGQYPLTR